ncbi:MAG: enoyl-CoA hydratase-related protein [Vicinamibacterales bacterium]
MPLIEITERSDVARVTLNRPEVRNAFNDALVAELTAWAERAATTRQIRAAVLQGAEPVFCAGADLEWMARMIAYSQEENVREASALARMFEALDTLPFPVVARVQGAALGGGAGLAAVCDIAVAAEDAVFGFTEVKLGILPAVISPYVVAKIGVSAARELFLTGRRFPAARAREIGLVHTVVAAGALDDAIEATLAELATSSPGAIEEAKALIPKIAGRRPSDVMTLTSGTIAKQRVSEDGQDGMKAFLRKQKPPWISS